MSRLVVVSNRCTVPKGGKAPGGLAVALTSALRQSGGLWFGWNGDISNHSPGRAGVTEVDGISYATLPLNRADYDAYYRGYANRVLWPLFHYRIDSMAYSGAYREGWRRTNALLVRKLLPLLQPDDVVWIHDYHLIPMAEALRLTGVEGRIGFFLHIPFPPYDVLRSLPNHRELMYLFCAYDLIGFQTDNDVRNFIDCAVRVTGAKKGRKGALTWGERTSRAGCFPISIDAEEVREMVASGRDSPTVKRLEQSLRGLKLVFGVDRLDYSKGIPQRFEAYRRMLAGYPGLLDQVVFLQVAQPSREDVPEYGQLRVQLERIVGEINGQFAEFDWVPIRYVGKSYARSTVMNFLSLAHVGLVTPLRDGMNLVAKEFIVAQTPENPGVLVLSCMTGAASELKSALVVNPHDADAVGEALIAALNMPLSERRERWRAARDVIDGHDVFDWARSFVNELQGTAA